MYSWDTFSKMADDAKVEYWTQSHTQNCLQSLNAESLLQSFTQAKKQRNDIFIPGESTCIKPINVEFGFPTPIPSITPISANCTPNLGLNHAQMGQSHKSNTNPTKDEPSIPPLLTRVPGMNMGISVSDVDREFWHITKQNQETMMVDCANAIKTTMIGSGFPVNEKVCVCVFFNKLQNHKMCFKLVFKKIVCVCVEMGIQAKKNCCVLQFDPLSYSFFIISISISISIPNKKTKQLVESPSHRANNKIRFF